MSRAALRIQKILRADGYAADLTKSSANESVGLLERVRQASNDHATIAVSLHYTGGIPFGEANAHFGVTPQHVGRYRTNASNGDTIRFTNARVAAESQRDAKIIQQARAAAGDGWTWHRSTRVSRSPVGCRRTATSQSSRSSTSGSRGSTTRTATSDSISTPTPPGSPTASSGPCPSHHASDHTLEAVPRRSPGSDQRTPHRVRPGPWREGPGGVGRNVDWVTTTIAFTLRQPSRGRALRRRSTRRL